jgi:hypothetical protein
MPSMKYPTSAGGAPRTVKYGIPLKMGATPGKTSTTRNGSANAPGINRVSLRGMCVDPGSSRDSPTIVTVIGSGVVVAGELSAGSAGDAADGLSRPASGPAGGAGGGGS